uniref:Uncharacterized protein n=1 Tax=Arundo donax TaxID=35708 RepID=A0A0A9BHF5_ARUDO
MMLHGSPLMI